MVCVNVSVVFPTVDQNFVRVSDYDGYPWHHFSTNSIVHSYSNLEFLSNVYHRFASPEELKAFEDSMINVEPLRNSRESKDYYPENSLIDMKLISPSSIRDLVDMYRIRWQHTQQTGVRNADKWRHLVENSHKNVRFY